MSLRSPLGVVLGTGSAKEGTGHWWALRVTSVALVPLTVWFVYSLLALPALDYGTVRAWLASPTTALLTGLALAVSVYHSYLGTTVIVEDYVHGPGWKVTTLMLLRFAYVLCGGAGVFAILRITLGA